MVYILNTVFNTEQGSNSSETRVTFICTDHIVANEPNKNNYMKTTFYI